MSDSEKLQKVREFLGDPRANLDNAFTADALRARWEREARREECADGTVQGLLVTCAVLITEEAKAAADAYANCPDYDRGKRDAWARVAGLRNKYLSQACDHEIAEDIAKRSAGYAAALDEVLIGTEFCRFPPEAGGSDGE